MGSPPIHAAFMLAFATLMLLICTPARAGEAGEDLELITDRPDFTESASAVPPLHLQAELGIDYSTIGEGRELAMPLLLMRFGVVRHLELRLEAPSYVASFGDDVEGPVRNGGESGVQPVGSEAYEVEDRFVHDASELGVGFKLAWDVGERGALGFLPMLAIPVRRPHYDSPGMTLGLVGAWAVDLNETFSLGGNLGVELLGLAADEEDVTAEYLASLALGIGLSEVWGMFLEVYGSIDHEPEVALIFDGGFTALVTPTTQLDIYAGVGITEAARGFNVGAGVSKLF